MRWPIQIQLLLPMLTVVVLAILLASGASAYLGAARARQIQEENLRHVATTVANTRFPLRQPVLQQMADLSRAEFIYLDDSGAFQAGSLEPVQGDLEQLQAVGLSPRSGASPVIALGGQNYLAQRVAVTGRMPGPPAGSLVVLYPEERWSASVRQAAYPALGAGAVAILAVVLITTALAHRFVRPIQRLGDQTAAIARGDFTPVAVSPRNDELRDLAVSINRMTQRLAQYESEVRRHEQLRTLGQLGAGMAHQLRNAATGGRMAIELHQRQCSAPGGESLEVALRQLRLMESYLQRFLALGRPAQAVREAVSLEALVEEVLPLLRPACLHAGVVLTFLKPAESLVICGDPDALRQLVMNLLGNAVEATAGQERSAKIFVELERLDGNRAVLRVKDTGPGVSDSVAGRLFEPFVTGKPDGTGLGLFVARRIAEEHQAAIAWERREGMTCFSVEFPL